jgi:hypothetical protein
MAHTFSVVDAAKDGHGLLGDELQGAPNDGVGDCASGVLGFLRHTSELLNPQLTFVVGIRDRHKYFTRAHDVLQGSDRPVPPQVAHVPASPR